MRLYYDDVWTILGQQREVTDDWFEKAKTELEYGGSIQGNPPDSALVEEFNSHTMPANTVCWRSHTPKFYATEYSRLSEDRLFVTVSQLPDPKRINTRNPFNGSRIYHDTPFSWLVSNGRQYKLGDVLLYFFRVLLVAQSFTSQAALDSLLKTTKRAFDFFGITHHNDHALDPDNVCSDMLAMGEHFGYMTKEDGFLNITQKGRFYLRSQNVDLDWPLIIKEKLENTESIGDVPTKREDINPSLCTQAQKAEMFGVDERTIRNWESGRTSPPSGYDASADKSTLETMGKLYQVQRLQRLQARALNRFDARHKDILDSDDPADIAAWNEEQNRK